MPSSSSGRTWAELVVTGGWCCSADGDAEAQEVFEPRLSAGSGDRRQYLDHGCASGWSQYLQRDSSITRLSGVESYVEGVGQ